MYYTVFTTFILLILANCNPQQKSTIVVKESKDFQLQYVTETKRISSGLFSEVVCDKQGNAYIASFKKMDDGIDRPYVVMLDNRGNKVWEIIPDTKGRANAIAINQDGHLWLAGTFEDQLEWDNCSVNCEGSAFFVAQLNKDGQCLDLNASKQNAIPSDIAVGWDYQIMVGGLMGSELKINSFRVINETGKDTYFLGKIGKENQCNNLETINGQIQRIKTDEAGNFLIVGSFQNELYTGVDQFESNYNKIEPRKERGFILNLSYEMGVNWAYQFQHKKFKEKVVDVIQLAEGKIATLRQLDSLHNSRLYLDIFDNKGQLIKSILINDNILKRTISTLVQHPNQHIWISTKLSLGPHIEPYKKTKEQREGRALLIELDAKGNLINEFPILHGRNTLIRSATSNLNGIVFAGHFQDSIKINDQRLISSGVHSIFTLRK